MKLIISGNPISQKNDKVIGYRWSNGKRVPFIMSSAKTKEWRSNAAVELRGQFEGYQVTKFPINVLLIFYFKSDTRRDLDNAAAGPMDALVEAGILPDDGVKYVDCLSLQYGGKDASNPRVEVYLDD